MKAQCEIQIPYDTSFLDFDQTMQSKDRGENNEEFNGIFNAISDAYIKNDYIKIDSDSLNS